MIAEEDIKIQLLVPDMVTTNITLFHLDSPTEFMNIMIDVFKDYTAEFVALYLDDIPLYSDSWENHKKHIKLVFGRLREHKLCAKLSSVSSESKKSNILDSYGKHEN